MLYAILLSFELINHIYQCVQKLNTLKSKNRELTSAISNPRFLMFELETGQYVAL